MEILDFSHHTVDCKGKITIISQAKNQLRVDLTRVANLMGHSSMEWPMNSSYECISLPTYLTLFPALFPPQMKHMNSKENPKVLCLMKNCLMITVNLLRSKGLEDDAYFEFLSTLVLAVSPELTVYHTVISVGAGMD